MSESRGAAEEAVDRYLERLDRALTPLPADEREEILRETRSHVADRLEAGSSGTSVHEILEELGRPEAYAEAFLPPSARRLPRSLVGLLTLARSGATGLAAFVALVTGYGLSFLLLAVAGTKILHPDRVGLWVEPRAGRWSLALTATGSAPPGEEVLGWWLVPLSVAAAAALYAVIRWVLSRLVGRPDAG